MPQPPAPVVVALLAVGVVLIGFAGALVARSGARFAMARRLAAAAPARVSEVLQLTEPASGAVRITGRIRCADPIMTSAGERFVAVHRTVEVHLRGAGWRPVEWLRQTRPFALWDHAGELTVDPADCAEPLVVIPAVWRGSPDQLPDEYRPSIERLESRYGPASAARSVTRSVNIIDRLLLVARPVVRDDAAIALVPPRGGYILTNLELDAALRLLSGRHPRRLVAGVTAGVLGVACLAAALIVSLIAGV